MSYEPKGKIEVSESGSRGHNTSGSNEHSRLIKSDVGITLSKIGREPPCSGGAPTVEKAGFGDDERANACRSDRCAPACAKPQPTAGILNLGFGQDRFEGIRHLASYRGDENAIEGSAHGGGFYGNRESLCRSHFLPHCHNLEMEIRNAHSEVNRKVVGRLESVENGREARVENAVKRQDGNMHGKNGIKSGSLVNTEKAVAAGILPPNQDFGGTGDAKGWSVCAA